MKKIMALIIGVLICLGTIGINNREVQAEAEIITMESLPEKYIDHGWYHFLYRDNPEYVECLKNNNNYYIYAVNEHIYGEKQSLKVPRFIAPQFDSYTYADSNRDLASVYSSDNYRDYVLHYFRYGISEKRKTGTDFFDRDFYIKNGGLSTATSTQDLYNDWWRFITVERKIAADTFSARRLNEIFNADAYARYNVATLWNDAAFVDSVKQGKELSAEWIKKNWSQFFGANIDETYRPKSNLYYYDMVNANVECDQKKLNTGNATVLFDLDYYCNRYGYVDSVDEKTGAKNSKYRKAVLNYIFKDSNTNKGDYDKGYRGTRAQLGLKSISIKSKPKTTYTYGVDNDKLNTDGLIINATMSDGIVDEIKPSQLKISGFSSEIGKHTITVSYSHTQYNYYYANGNIRTKFADVEKNTVTKTVTFDIEVVKGPQVLSGSDSERTYISYDGVADSVELDVKNSKADGGRLVYSVVSGQDVVDVDQYTGQVTVKDGGKATIMIKAEENDYYNESEPFLIEVIVDREIYLNTDGGELDDDVETRIKAEYGTSISLDDKKYIPVKEGYDFICWYDTRHNVRLSDKKYDNDGYAEIIALWKSHDVKLKFVPYEGSQEDYFDITTQYGVDILMKKDGDGNVCPYEDDEKEFVGWKIGNQIINWGKTFQITPDMTDKVDSLVINGVWKDKEKESYRINYMYTDVDGIERVFGYNIQVEGQNTTIPELDSKYIPNGYTLKGWKCGEQYFAVGAVVCFESNADLRADFIKKKYDVEYNSNGGVGTVPSKVKVEYEGDYYLEFDVSLDKTGYIFAGWTDVPNSKEAKYIEANSSVPVVVKDNMVFYAVWKPIVRNLVLDVGEGTRVNVPSLIEKEYGKEATIPKEIPYRTGYDFLGWSEDSNATEKDVLYIPGSKYSKDILENVTLYAIWEIKDVVVSFNMNGGTGSLEPIYGYYFEEKEISDYIPSRAGYDFAGWSRNKNDNEPEFDVNNNVIKLESESDTIQLYAVWKKKTYNVTYDCNGGAGMCTGQDKVYGEDCYITATIPTRDGYEFVGWNREKEATTAEYQPGAVYKENNAIVLYAVWKKKQFRIEYNANGGTGKPSDVYKEYNDTIILSDIIPVREGYEFKGWSDSYSASQAKYAAGAEYNENKDIILYAVWQIKKYTVKYNLNGAAESIPDQNKTHNESLNLSNVTPVREGYTFLGWAIDEEADEVEYYKGSTYNDNKSITLYAVWQVKTYTISYEGNGGSGVPEEDIKEHGESIFISDVIPVRDGYTFLGWSDKDYGDKVTYAPEGEYKKNESIVLYAVWSKDEKEVPDIDNSDTNLDFDSDFNSDSELDNVPDNNFNNNQVIDETDSIKLEKTTYNVELKGKISLNVKSAGTVTYKSSNSKIATVSSTGVVRAKKYGKVTITIKSGAVSKKVTVFVVPKAVKIGKVKVLKKGNQKGLQIRFSKMSGVKQYEIQISSSKSFKNDSRKTMKYIINAKKNPISALCKYKNAFIRMRAYVKIGSKKYAGAWSVVKFVRL